MAKQKKAKQKAEEAAGIAQEEAGKLADQAKGRARSKAAQQKERVSSSLSKVAQALHKTGDDLRNENQKMAASYADSAAGQVERVGQYLQEHSPEELVSETEHFARREPELFLGGAFALGALGARFLKSSSKGSSSTKGGASRQQQSPSKADGARETPTTRKQSSKDVKSYAPS